MNYDKEVALLLPVNSKGEILIQDRTGHKPPPWGFFGGKIDAGETAEAAVLREAKEELDLDLASDDISFLATSPAQFENLSVQRHFFLYRTEQASFTVLEGRAAHWMSYENAKEYLDPADTIDAIVEMIS